MSAGAVGALRLFGLLLCILTIRALSVYEIGRDDLTVTSAGFLRQVVAYEDVVRVEAAWGFLDEFWQRSYYQLGLRRTVRIEQRGWTTFVLINPKNSQTLIDAIEAFRADRLRVPRS